MQARPVLRVYWLLSFVVAALLLCSVALVNRGPIYYPDTAAYLIDAEKFTHLQAPFAVRPIFYGLAIWPFHWGTLYYPALLVQALIVAHVIYLTARACDCGLGPGGFVGLVLALVILTPVSFHVSHLLPDVFVAVLILSLFLLAFCNERLGRAEAWYLLLLATAAASFHLTAIPIGLALFALAVTVAIVTRRRRVAAVLALLPALLAIILLLSFSFAVFQRLTLTPKNPPHLLARIIADGPGRDFLRKVCPEAAFTLCYYQDRLTPVEDDFLWRLLPNIPPVDGYRIKAEASAVLRGTVAMYPVEVARHMLGNTLRQLVTFRSETQVSQQEWDEFQADGTTLARSVTESLQAQRKLERPAFDMVNAFHRGVALVSLVASLALAGLTVRVKLFRPTALIATVLCGLVANAFVCGAFGGVFGRYEGRVIWLLPLAAIAVALALLRARPLRNRTLRYGPSPNAITNNLPAAGLEPASPVTDVRL